MSFISFIGNLTWFLFGGFIISGIYMLIGLLFCLTIIGIPFGLQLMKISIFAMFPFGKQPEIPESGLGCVGIFFNILWIIFGGVEIAIMHVLLGVFFCITIIGIPFGLQHFKLAQLCLFPFGQFVANK